MSVSDVISAASALLSPGPVFTVEAGGVPLRVIRAPLTLDSFNLAAAERHLCEQALLQAGSIVHAAELLGVTPHSLKRRIVKLGIEWPRAAGLADGAES